MMEYLLDSKFKIIITDSYINVINYKELISINSNNIILKYNNGSINIKGNDLLITKLLDEELLIKGNINNIEFR